MPNVAVIVLDTLRKDYFDKYFDWLPGRRFERAYSTGNWTVPAHASLFTGAYASEVGVHAKSLYLDCERPSIVEKLSDAGYRTRAISANPNISPSFDFHRGFDEFHGLTTPSFLDNYDRDEIFDWQEFAQKSKRSGLLKYLGGAYQCFRSDARTIPSLRYGVHRAVSNPDDSVAYGGATEALSLLEGTSLRKNEFLFINLMETHEPYVAPSEYLDRTPPLTESIGDLQLDGEVPGDKIRGAYDASARYLSDVYRDVFEHLREDFDYVFTLADHGELLGEGGAWAHEHGVHPALTHVPLCISNDDLSGESMAATSLLDVHATIAAISGVDVVSRGRDLRGGIESGEFLAEYHGLTPWSERRLREKASSGILNTYDKERFGYANATGYAYEDREGLEFEEGKNRDSVLVREQIDRLLDERDVRAAESRTEVPDEVADRLSDLGYA